MSAEKFLIAMEQDDALNAELKDRLDKINSRNDYQQFLTEIVAFGGEKGFAFSSSDYASAAQKYARDEIDGLIKKFRGEVVAGPWTTQGTSCITACPTTNHAGCA